MNKPPEKSIYWTPTPVTEELAAELDILDKRYRSRGLPPADDRFRYDIGVVMLEIDTNGRWYDWGVCMSKGEASAIRTCVNRGEYGRGMRCVMKPVTNLNNGANPNQDLHRMYAKR